MHSSHALAPPARWKEPAGHCSHAPSPAVANEPAAHAIGAVDPVGHDEPAGHCSHASAPGKVAKLPAAHTCFNQLDLPEYKSEEETREKLKLALKEGSGGFGFG